MNTKYIVNTEKKHADLHLTKIDKSMSKIIVKYFTVYTYSINHNDLIASMKKYLEINPYIAGTLIESNQESYITTPGKGVLFIHHAFDENIPDSSFKKLENIKKGNEKYEEFSKMHTPGDHIVKVREKSYNNGTILEVECPHFIFDGPSVFSFIATWSSIFMGEEYIKPELDRSSILRKEKNLKQKSKKIGRDIDIESTSPPEQDNRYEEKYFHISKENIKKIAKEEIKNISNTEKIPNNYFISYLLKTIANHNSFKINDPLSLVSVYDIRKTLNLGSSYFGNAVTHYYLKTSVREITENTIVTTADSIKKMKDHINEEILENFDNDNLEASKILQNTNTIYLNNMASIPIYDINFGKGNPIWVEALVAKLPFRRITLFKAPKINEGIIFCLCLPHNELEIFSDKFLKKMA